MIEKSQKLGSSLIEVLIALVVMAVVLMSIVSAVVLSLRSADMSRHRSRAAFLGSAGLEWLRGQRAQLGWSGFSALDPGGAGTTYCLNTFPESVSTWNAGSCVGVNPIEGIYVRRVTFTAQSADVVQVVVETEWGQVRKSDGQPFTVPVTAVFSNWEENIDP